MGIFSSKKTVVVSSTLYNLAGPEADRPNFLKSSLFSAVLSPYDLWIGETVVNNHLHGPGIRQRSFMNWAIRNDFAGLPALSIQQHAEVDPAVVKPLIPLSPTPAGLEIELQRTFITGGDFTYWTDQYMLANYPELNDTAYTSDYDPILHEITIEFELGGSETFAAGTYDPDKDFLVTTYAEYLPETVLALVPGTPVTGVTNVLLLPDISAYDLQTVANTGLVNHSRDITIEVVKVYSNGDPTVTTGPDPFTVIEPFNPVQRDYYKNTFNGGDGTTVKTTSTESWITITEYRQIITDTVIDVVVNDLGGGDTETVTTTTIGDFLQPVYDHVEDTQDTIQTDVVGGTQMWIYELGSGAEPTLDAYIVDVGVPPDPEFFPFIPIRLNNVSITAPLYDTNGLYDECKTAYRRATSGLQFSKVVAEVEANPDLNVIDYAYINYGVSLNVLDESARKYIYLFFKEMIQYQSVSATAFANFIIRKDAYASNTTEFNNWLTGQFTASSPYYNQPKPTFQALQPPPLTTMKLKSSDPRVLAYDNRISWLSINEEFFFSGLAKPGAKKGDVWLEKAEDITWTETFGYPGGADGDGTVVITILHSIKSIYIYEQTDLTKYSRLHIHGLVHRNYIYGGHHVVINAHDAIDDPDPSGFQLPMHAPTVKSMSLVHSTQMATANTHILFNSLEIFKSRWYENFFVMLIIIIVIVIIAVLINPALAAEAVGILGTNAAAGTALGLTGTAAIVAGAVLNTLAAVIIGYAISEASTEIFGEKYGPLVGSIVNFALSFGIAGGFTNFNMASMFTPQNLLQMADVLANGYAGFVQADIAELNDQLLESQKEYDREIRLIEDQMRDWGNNSGLSFNPMALTNVEAGNGSRGNGTYVSETLDEFIHRTTLTGSDIVDVTHAMISDYAKLNLTLP